MCVIIYLNYITLFFHTIYDENYSTSVTVILTFDPIKVFSKI